MADYRETHKQVLDDLLLDIPGVIVGKAFGYPAYKIKGKVFAFVGGDGIGIKLPVAQVQTLIESHPACTPFQPAEGITWKAWVSITYTNSDDYRNDIALLEESVAFVAG